MTERWTPKSDLANVVYQAGFNYDPKRDIIYSRMDAWQRGFGYAYAYDLVAPVSISAVIDCEPFFFEYDSKHWMIELWKGQYGLETGGEVGVYVSREKRPLLDSTLGNRPNDEKNSVFFDCANDDERLEISFSLKRDGELLFERGPEKHWWLTGFKWGVLSIPEQIEMDVKIRLPGKEMRDRFKASLTSAGYQFQEDGDSISFLFDAPRTDQPRKLPSNADVVAAALDNNQKIVNSYNELNLTSNDPNNLASEFTEYFELYQLPNLKNQTERFLKKHGVDARSIKKAINGIEKKKPLLERLIDFFKRIFS